MKVLLTGGTGLLGKALIEVNKDMQRVWAVYIGDYNMPDTEHAIYFKADVRKKQEIEGVFLRARPELVIHTAGIASVDFCEKNYNEAYCSNVIGTNNVIELCKKHGSKLVYISSNAIFDGKNPPYSEDDPPCPINNYGKLKLESEELVKKSKLQYLIVRPILMYGWNNENERLNPVTRLLKKLQDGEEANMVNDVYTNALLNHNCAEAIWSLVKFNKEGIYHVAGRDIVNHYELAKITADVFGLSNGNLIRSVSSDFFPDIASRPKNTSYRTEKIQRELNIEPLGIKKGLLHMKKTRP